MRKHDTGEKRMQIAGGHPPPHCNNAAAVREGLGNPGRRPRVRAPQWPTPRPCLRKTDAAWERNCTELEEKDGGKKACANRERAPHELSDYVPVIYGPPLPSLWLALHAPYPSPGLMRIVLPPPQCVGCAFAHSSPTSTQPATFMCACVYAR